MSLASMCSSGYGSATTLVRTRRSLAVEADHETPSDRLDAECARFTTRTSRSRRWSRAVGRPVSSSRVGLPARSSLSSRSCSSSVSSTVHADSQTAHGWARALARATCRFRGALPRRGRRSLSTSSSMSCAISVRRAIRSRSGDCSDRRGRVARASAVVAGARTGAPRLGAKCGIGSANRAAT